MSIARKIPKGRLGEFSKIREEFLELEEAHEIGNKIHLGMELSDLVGAIWLYAENRGYDLNTIVHHAAMKRAYFEDQDD